MTLEELIGACLVFGIPGTQATPDLVRHFKETHAGGVILYRRNFESPRQVIQLIRELEEALGRRLLIVVDHEGGRVIMFKDGVTVFPDSWAVGMSHDVEAARRQGEIEAKELRRFGVDVNFAPVVDVLTDAYSPNIGIRSYGKDPLQVAEFSAARITAMQKGGISATAKHFPGKGHAPVDAHLGLPVIDSSWDQMKAVHLAPFLRAMEAGVDVIMTSHPIYSKLDPDTPVTFSKRLVKEFLRGELGFKGVISSDDLEMGALKNFGSIGESAVRAKEAGHDLLLICHTPEKQREVFEQLREAYKAGRLSKTELEESVKRIEQLKAKRPQRFEGGDPRQEPEGPELAAQMAQKAVTVLRNPLTPTLSLQPTLAEAASAGEGQGRGSQKRIPSSLMGESEEGKKDSSPLGGEGRVRGSVAVIFPRFSELWPRIMMEDVFLKEADFLRKEFGDFGVRPEIQLVGVENPTDVEIENARKLTASSDAAVLFVFDAHLHPANKKLLDAVQSSARNLAVVLLRDPYDVEFVSPQAACLTAYGFRACQIRACLKALQGQ